MATDRQWQEVAESYGRSYLAASPHVLDHTIGVHLTQLLPTCQTDSPRWPVLIKLAVVQAMVSGALGDSDRADTWYRLAINSARASHSHVLFHWAAGRRLFRAAYEGRSPEAIIKHGNQLMSVEGLLAMAMAYAKMSNETMARDYADSARRLWDLSTPCDDEQSIFEMPYWRLMIATNYVYGLLGNPHRIVKVAHDIPARWQAQYLLTEALAETRQGYAESGRTQAALVLNSLLTEDVTRVHETMAYEAGYVYQSGGLQGIDGTGR